MQDGKNLTQHCTTGALLNNSAAILYDDDREEGVGGFALHSSHS